MLIRKMKSENFVNDFAVENHYTLIHPPSLEADDTLEKKDSTYIILQAPKRQNKTFSDNFICAINDIYCILAYLRNNFVLERQ